MPTDERIVDCGGAIGIRDGDRVIRLASIDGTKHAEVLKALRGLVEAARAEGRNGSAK